MVYTDIDINVVNNTEIKKKGKQTLSGVKICIGQTELHKKQVIVLNIICRTGPIGLLCVKN